MFLTHHAATVFIVLALAFLPPTTPAFADVPECDYDDPPDTASALDPTVKGGVVKDTTITLPHGWDVELEEPLLVMSGGPLTINGDIIARDSLPYRVDITLVSRTGDVTINGAVGDVARQTRVPDGKPDLTTGKGGNGESGGSILIIAPIGSIIIQQDMNAENGGHGGDAKATSQTISQEHAQNANLILADGGEGGTGGNIRLCAGVSIFVGARATVRAGDGGKGGTATAIQKPLAHSFDHKHQ